jgi:hypothetical protein
MTPPEEGATFSNAAIFVHCRPLPGVADPGLIG